MKPWLGVRTLDISFKPATNEELERSEAFMKEVRRRKAINDYWSQLSFDEKEKLIVIHKSTNNS
jgi:hypothetical protein